MLPPPILIPSFPKAGDETVDSRLLRVQPTVATMAHVAQARASQTAVGDTGSHVSAAKVAKATAARAARMTRTEWTAGGRLVRAATAARPAARLPAMVVLLFAMILFYTVHDFP
jgi:hypothetical protein